jgi:hypothetical protein
MTTGFRFGLKAPEANLEHGSHVQHGAHARNLIEKGHIHKSAYNTKNTPIQALQCLGKAPQILILMRVKITCQACALQALLKMLQIMHIQ